MIADQQLRQMAETAFKVLNWARREGFKKDVQLDQVVEGFKLDLREFDSISTCCGGAVNHIPWKGIDEDANKT